MPFTASRRQLPTYKVEVPPARSGGEAKSGDEPRKSGSEPRKSGGGPKKSGSEPKKSGGEPRKSGGGPRKSNGEPRKSGSEPRKSNGEPRKSGSEPRKSGGEPRKSGSELKKPDRLPLYGPLGLESIKAYHDESKTRFASLYWRPCPFVTDPSSFKHIRKLGEGAFGTVLLSRDKRSDNLYALKALDKRHIFASAQVEHCLNEKRVLQTIDFPFGVRMEFFARDNTYLYFIMPFISGGEMFTYLQKRKRFTEQVSRFFAAQVVLALEYLHHLSLVYRDLKPENVLIDHLGYVKLTDFGFTKPVAGRTYTFCGTPHYVAPEVIIGHGYGHSVDWWSFGVLIYEMNFGTPPYEARDQMVMFKLILQNRYLMPTFFSAPLRDLIQKLLETDVTRRFGNLKGRADDIKRHPWFQTVDWLEIFNRNMVSPFVPTVEPEEKLRESKESVVLPVAETDLLTNEFKDF